MMPHGVLDAFRSIFAACTPGHLAHSINRSGKGLGGLPWNLSARWAKDKRRRNSNLTIAKIFKADVVLEGPGTCINWHMTTQSDPTASMGFKGPHNESEFAAFHRSLTVCR